MQEKLARSLEGFLVGLILLWCPPSTLVVIHPPETQTLPVSILRLRVWLRFPYLATKPMESLFAVPAPDLLLCPSTGAMPLW